MKDGRSETRVKITVNEVSRISILLVNILQIYNGM